MGHTAIRYLHQAYPREEMVALFLAADVMLVTALRDGMNLVAKEYVASRVDNRGVLILSEFAGAADELGTRGARQPARHRGAQGGDDARGRDDSGRAGAAHARRAPARARAQRRGLVARVPRGAGDVPPEEKRDATPAARAASTTRRCTTRCARVAASDRLLVALDFDGTLAPLEDEPMKARALPAAAAAVAALAALPDTPVAFVSGRSLHDLREIAEHADDAQIFLAGSHGAEFWVPGRGRCSTPTTTSDARRCATSCATR